VIVDDSMTRTGYACAFGRQSGLTAGQTLPTCLPAALGTVPRSLASVGVWVETTPSRRACERPGSLTQRK
jgi:hypothetical protein